MLRTSTAADIPALQALWQRCFGDPPAYTRLYFAHLWQPEQVFIAAEGPEVQAMAIWFPPAGRWQTGGVFLRRLYRSGLPEPRHLPATAGLRGGIPPGQRRGAVSPGAWRHGALPVLRRPGLYLLRNHWAGAAGPARTR